MSKNRGSGWIVAALALAAASGQAMTIAVNSTADFPDISAGDGKCRINPGGPAICTLRAAIQEANDLSGPDEILLPAGTYNLTIPGFNEDQGAIGDLDITDDLEIQGSGVSSTIINGLGDITLSDRVFHVLAEARAPVVEISHLTIQNGNAGWGGGIYIGNALVTLANVAVVDNTGHNGAGISTSDVGVTVLHEVTVMNNVVSGLSPSGGGIFNQGDITIAGSAIVANGSTLQCGGIVNDSAADLRIINSTISLNYSVSDGGGICNMGTLEIANGTLAGNLAGADGDDLWQTSAGQAYLKTSILSSPNPASCGGSGMVTSGGYNLENGNSCGLTHATDQVSTNPQLLTLSGHGGPTLVWALAPSSSAIDALDDDLSPCTDLDGAPLTEDQRGRPRPADGDGDGNAYCDIGAFELLNEIFLDGFESAGTGAWSSTLP